MKHDEFKVGMRVRQKVDEGDGPITTYGKITEVNADHIVIDWNDIDEPLKHFDDEWDSIKPGQPGDELK